MWLHEVRCKWCVWITLVVQCTRCSYGNGTTNLSFECNLMHLSNVTKIAVKFSWATPSLAERRAWYVAWSLDHVNTSVAAGQVHKGRITSMCTRTLCTCLHMYILSRTPPCSQAHLAGGTKLILIILVRPHRISPISTTIRTCEQILCSVFYSTRHFRAMATSNSNTSTSS